MWGSWEREEEEGRVREESILLYIKIYSTIKTKIYKNKKIKNNEKEKKRKKCLYTADNKETTSFTYKHKILQMSFSLWLFISKDKQR